jgi:hypothetical protein
MKQPPPTAAAPASRAWECAPAWRGATCPPRGSPAGATNGRCMDHIVLHARTGRRVCVCRCALSVRECAGEGVCAYAGVHCLFASVRVSVHGECMWCLKVCVVQSTCAAGMATYLVNVVHGGLGSGGGRHQVAAHTAQTKPTRQAKWGTQLIRTMLQSGARGRVSEGVGPTPHVLLGIVRVAHDPGTPLLSVPNLGVTDNTTQHNTRMGGCSHHSQGTQAHTHILCRARGHA